MKIAILSIRGMGKTRESKHAELEANLGSEFYGNVDLATTFYPIDYHKAFQEEQVKLWEKIIRKHKGKIDQRLMRKYLLYYVSDAAAYESNKSDSESLYFKIHQIVFDTIQNLYSQLGEDTKLVIVAQSLGGQIISNYIWDLQKTLEGSPKGIWKSKPLPSDKVQKFETLRFLFTTGCNIPLFSAGQTKIEAIKPPNSEFEWFNYYDRDDILGWPLKELSKTGHNGVENGYFNIVEEDIEINTGHHVLSHVRYWNRKSYYGKIAAKINTILN